MPLKTPDITAAQILALVQAVCGLVVAFGFDITQKQQDAIIAFCTAGLVFLPLADAIIRHGRAQVAAARLVVDGNDQHAARVTNT